MRIKMRELACLLVAALAGTVFAAQPNVVFIMADDLGWKDLGCQGSTYHKTPNIDRLANRSVRFTNYYTASPLCSPTRSSILAGLYPARTGITAPVCHLPALQLEKRLAPGNGNQKVLNADSLTRLKTEYTTLAQVFKAAGYSTAHFGKWHLGHGKGYEPKDRGFDVDIPHTPRAAGPGGGYLAPWKFIQDPEFKGAEGEHIDFWMAGQAGRFIQENRGKPFYVNFWLYSVHGPWNARKADVDAFGKTADPKNPQHNPLYAAMIKGMDDAVGRLLDALEKSGMANNTIVVFTSDNGGYAYEPRNTDPKGYEDTPATSNLPLRSGKASNYEGGTRVPCLVSWPGHTRSSVCEGIFSSVDWFPTLVALTGIKPKELPKLDGINQAPSILEGKPVRDTAYVHFPHGGENQDREKPGFWPATWVRHGDWKLIRFYGKNEDNSDLHELYNLREDIGETKNLATSNPDLVRQLARKMDAFLGDTEAVIPKINPNWKAKPKVNAPGKAAWNASKDALLEIQDGRLKITSKGTDPFVFTSDIKPGIGPYVVEFRMKSNSKGTCQVFWMTDADKTFFRERSVVIQPRHDDAWHNYELKFPVEKPLVALRLDPSNGPGDMLLENIRVKSSEGKLLGEWFLPGK
ncbi:MAG: sulfatase [Gemmataceae bacterium]